MNEDTNQLIVVRQLPIIEERLRSLSEEIEIKVQEAMSLICTEETIKSVKTVRAELNKQFNELENQRKTVKKAVLDPYEAFEKVYKDCVSSKYLAADTELKGKIDSVENDLKQQKEDEAKRYYCELATAYGITFVTWENAGIKVTLSTSLKALKEQIARGLSKIMDDLSIISRQTYKDEILAEYKQSLNLNQAITYEKSIEESIQHNPCNQYTYSGVRRISHGEFS